MLAHSHQATQDVILSLIARLGDLDGVCAYLRAATPEEAFLRAATRSVRRAAPAGRRRVRLDFVEARVIRTELNDPTTFNAQTPPFMESLLSCAREVRRLCAFADSPAHVLEGVGAHFCTGGRHDEHRRTQSFSAALADLSAQSSITAEIRASLFATSAAVHGKLIGGGVALALAADWRVCPEATTFTFGNLPRGVNPILMFSRALPLMVGRSPAFQIYVEDAALSSWELRSLGLVNEVVADTEEARRCAKHVAVDRPLARSSSARICSTDAAHAAREVIYFAESSAACPRHVETHHVTRAREPPRPRVQMAMPETPGLEDAAVIARVFEVLGTLASRDAPLMAAGVDSLGATEFQKALSADLSVELPATLLFDHPSVSAIVEFVASASETVEAAMSLARVQAPTDTSSALGVSKVTMKISGDVAAAPRLRELASGASTTPSSVPATRWNVVEPTSAAYGSLIVDGLRVDSRSFGIQSFAAEQLDP